MECEHYRTLHERFSALPLPREVWDTPEWEAWMDHFHACQACSDWDLAQRVRARGARPEDFPCVHTADQVTYRCEQHADLSECDDVWLLYLPRFDEFVLSTAGAQLAICFCPMCGTPRGT